MQSWCKSVIGGLFYYARGVRWDISHAVSRIAQTTQNPSEGTVAAIEWLAGYLMSTLEFDLVGQVNPEGNELINYVDSSFRGDTVLDSRSQSGNIVLLNGVPIHWRSSRQPRTAMSPGVAEIYAMSVGVKEARLMGGRLSNQRTYKSNISNR